VELGQHGYQKTFSSNTGLKCKGTTKKEALLNDEKREAWVVQHFCRYKLEYEGEVGAVVLDYNYAVDHVRHCLNSALGTSRRDPDDVIVTL